MQYRRFGRSGISVSEFGVGAWAIGGESYGPVARAAALAALVVAEEAGCTLVDTAAVYGASEDILGEFLRGRRSRWFVATKYSGQPEGLRATLEAQLRRLGTDHVDFYQTHWVPRGSQAHLIEELLAVRGAGLTRRVGLSLYTARDVAEALAMPGLDGVQLPCSLLDSEPYVGTAQALADRGLGVLVRSAMKAGFLTGKYSSATRLTLPTDQRSRLSAASITSVLSEVDACRALVSPTRSLTQVAARYPLSFAATSSVLLGSKTTAQAHENYRDVPGPPLSDADLGTIATLQRGFARRRGGAFGRWLRRLLGR